MPLRAFILGLTIIATPLVTLPRPACADLTMSARDRAVAARASDVLTALANGRIDRLLLASDFRADFTDAVVAEDQAALSGHGAVKRMSLQQKIDGDTSVRYVFAVEYADGALFYTFGIDKGTDLIDALYFRPGPAPQ